MGFLPNLHALIAVPPHGSQLQRAEHVVFVAVVASTVFWILTGKLKKIGFGVVRGVVGAVQQMPLLGNVVEQQVKSQLQEIERHMLGDGDENANTKLPQNGIPSEKLLAMLSKFREEEQLKSQSKLFGGVFFEVDGAGVTANLATVQSQVFEMYNKTNALYPNVFPSVRKFEAEIVQMILSLTHGHEVGAAGLLTSGGTESILIAMLSYVNQAKSRGVKNPNVVCCVTAHPALDKAAKYFNFSLIKLPADKNQQLNPIDVDRAINSSTIAVYASCPTFPHGVIDPIREIGHVISHSKHRNVALHVDNCLGGFYVSFLSMLGEFKEEWDFNVPAVTSISVDIHKYGFSPKGASVVVFRTPKLREATFCPVTTSTSLYITPTLQGARSGATIAMAWSTMMSIGIDGYKQAFSRLHALHTKIKIELGRTEGLSIAGNPTCSIVAVTSNRFNVHALSGMMEKRGWNLFSSREPSCVAVCVSLQLETVVDQLLKDIRECTAYLLEHPNTAPEGEAGVYGVLDFLPQNVLNQVLCGYVDVKMKVKEMRK